MVIEGPLGVHREKIPFEYSATGTSIARAATRFRASERADLESIEPIEPRSQRAPEAKLFREHVTVRQVC